jgi:hypothetical protein
MIHSYCDVCKKTVDHRELIDGRRGDFQVTLDAAMPLCDMCKPCMNELCASLNKYREKQGKAFTKRLKAHVLKWIAAHEVKGEP